MNVVYFPSNLRFHSFLHRPSPPLLQLSCVHSGGRAAEYGSVAIRKAIPARDRVIDFGKFKGKMLGTLPSSYLKWVSKNLRARDFEEWAELADEVLYDPVYNDRIEWEFAQNVLNGDVLLSATAPSAVSELLEISQRFGWDNDDEAGWSKIDFSLLGTSKGGRIPRVGDSDSDGRNDRTGMESKLRRLKKEGGEEEADRGRRERRRERLRATRTSDSSTAESLPRERVAGLEIRETLKGNVGNADGNRVRVDGSPSGRPSPFPGREALLKKVLSRRRLS
ncbi:uncharacterized protein LOC116008628 [Ipomoea triloba]|uniref:uncharacterized protein LOC116008628 n=1 Tax=Ipomoea triloba TaxID=35885 RepID=UPI00125D355B|nr:uncharacterized protein LOC116008628 [Ipomoea triloba]